MAAYDSNYKMKPPLRCCGDVDAVIDGIVNGVVEVLATDHAPHAGSEKMQEFERCPFGITGLETAIGLTLERLVHPGKITVKHMVELYTTHPARVMNLPKGRLAVGESADVTIFSTGHEWVYDVNQTYSKSKNSPFHGHKFKGGPVATVVGGKFVWKTAMV